MAKTSEVFGKIITKELLLESRNGNVKITIDEEGSLVLGADVDSSNGSFKISPSNNSLQIPEIKFTDGTSITSTSYLEIQQNSIKGKDAYNNFNWPSSKLKDTVLSDSVVGDLGKARDVYSKFDWNSSRLKDESLSDSVSGSLEKARNAYDRFNWPSGKLKDDSLSDAIKTDIGRGVNTYDRFDWPNGVLKDDFLSEFLKNRITKGFEAYDRFDWPLGKLNDNNLSDAIKEKITKGVNAFDTFSPKFGSDGFLKDDFVSQFLKDRITKGVNAFDTFSPKFGSDGFLKDDFVSTFLKDRITKGVTAEGKFGSDGKLLDSNLRDGLLNNINLGVSSYNDLGSLDFSFDNSNPNIPVIKLSRGSRGNSSSSFSKSSIGLANVENKSSATIRSETFADTIFTAVQNNASSAVSTANTANSNASSALTNATSALTTANNAKSTADTIEGRFTSGLLNEANAAASLRNSNLSFTQGSDGTITLNRGSGLASITTNPLSTSTFTTLQSTANTAKSTADTANSNASTALTNASTALTNASTALTTANTAKSTADTINTRFDINGRIKSANLSADPSGFNFTDSNKLQIGSSTANTNDSSYNSDSDIEIVTGSVGTPDLSFYKVQAAGDIVIGRIVFKGWDGTKDSFRNYSFFTERARIEGYVNTTAGGVLKFYTALQGTKNFGAAATNVEARMTIDSDGQVGIGTETPTAQLDVVGGIRIRTPLATGSKVVGLSSNNTFALTTSDMRLKKNVKTIKNALQKVQNLRGVEFNWDFSSDPELLVNSEDLLKDQIGLIAQEVENIIPQVVVNNGIKDYKTINYAELVSVLIEAIKELKLQVDSLKTEIEVVKSNSI